MKKILILIYACLLSVSGVRCDFPDNNCRNSRIYVALNYYSFNHPLRSGEESIESVLDYASRAGFDAVDITGYYFPGYPAVPSEEYINQVKYHALRQGIRICGTGMKNDFTLPDPAQRKKEKTARDLLFR